MREIIEILGSNLMLLIILLIGATMLVSSFMRHLSAIVIASAREKSRREIAAYIAEGSITPDQGERLMKVDVNSDRSRLATPFA